MVSIFKPLLSHDAIIGLAVGGILLIFSVVLLPIRTGPWFVRWSEPPPSVVSVEKETSDEALLLRPGTPPDMTFAGLFKSLDFYLLFFVYFACVGPSVAVVNNMFALVISKSFSTAVPSSETFVNMWFPEASLPNRQLVTTFVALFASVRTPLLLLFLLFVSAKSPQCNTLGRLGFGFVSDKLKLRVQRTFWLVVSVSMLLG